MFLSVIFLSACSSGLPNLLKQSYLMKRQKDVVATQTIASLTPKLTPKVPMQGNLDIAVNSAAKVHPQFLAAQYGIEEAKVNLDISEASTKPQISTSIFSGLDDIENLSAGVTASLNLQTLLYDGGKADLQRSLDELNIENAKLSLEKVQNSLVLGFYNDFNNLASLELIEEVYANKIQVINEYKTRLNTMKNAGVIDSSAISQAQRISNDITKNLELTSIDRQLVEEKLGLYFSDTIIPTGAIQKSIAKLKRSKASILKNLEVKTAYLQVSAATIRVEQAKRTNSYDVVFQSGVRQTIGSSLDTQPTLGIALSKPVYRGGLLQAQINSANASKQRASSDFNTTYSKVKEELKLLDVNLRAVERKLNIVKQETLFSRTEIDRINSQLTIGRSSINDLISEENNLLELELQTIQLEKEKNKLTFSRFSWLGAI